MTLRRFMRRLRNCSSNRLAFIRLEWNTMKKLLVVAVLLYALLGGSVVHAKHYPTIKCWNHYDIIEMVSESKEMMYQVDYIMYRESRCTASVINREDPNGGSIGLFQINKFWCKPNKYTKQGFLQDAGVLTKCKDLYNPVISGKAFMAIYDYADNRYGDGFGPWGGEPWN
jgi:hypothetical protein